MIRKLLRFFTISAIAIMFATAVASQTNTEVEGLITQPSNHSVEMTIEKFEEAVRKRGLTLFTRLDHAKAAETVGLTMPEATVIVFGNPRLGTPNFIQAPTLAIDLPLKALIWEDETGDVFVSYNSADYLFKTIYDRHGLQGDEATLGKVKSTLAAIAAEASN